MIKKYILPFIILMSLSSFALPGGNQNGVGLIFGAPDFGVGLSLKINTFPVIGLTYSVDTKNPGLGLICDYWVVNNPISSPVLNYYVGVGGFLTLRGGNNDKLNFGARIPIGLQIFPIEQLEIFLEAVPMVPLWPSPSVTFLFALGLRVCF